MVDPLISILVLVYGAEPYVERCVRSLFEQTYDNIEYIFCNDCSPDASISILEQVIKDYPNRANRVCILHHDHNCGIGVARNTCLEAASGDYFFYVDSDDEITVDCIEKLVEPLSERQYDLVIGDTRTIGDERLSNILSLKLNDGEVLEGEEIVKTYRKKWNMTSWNKLYRTAFIRQQKLRFKEWFSQEDELWCFQVACLAKSLRVVNRVTYIYCVREGSLITSNSQEQWIKMIKAVVEEMRCFLISRKLFSAGAYNKVQYYFWRSLRPVMNNRKQFIYEYCQLRKAVHFPLYYRIKTIGFCPRAQVNNLYYLIPPQIAARIIYWRKHR